MSKYDPKITNAVTAALMAARDLRDAVWGQRSDLARTVNAAATQIELAARATRDAHDEACGEG